MITSEFIRTMARYNCWQNQSIYGACDQLDDAARKQDRGAFFKSIHGTLCHLLWGDQIWMSRFAGHAGPAVQFIPDSPDMIADWDDLKQERTATDSHLLDWANRLEDHNISGDLTWYSGALGKEFTKPLSVLLVHFFNHQTHHRGQIHAMVTAAGGKPDDTDIPFIPDDMAVRQL